MLYVRPTSVVKTHITHSKSTGDTITEEHIDNTMPWTHWNMTIMCKELPTSYIMKQVCNEFLNCVIGVTEKCVVMTQISV